VTMVGHVADTRPLIAAMDVLVSASSMEPFGIVLLEASVQETPVVAVADAGPREIVTHGVTGLLVARPEPELLARAARDLLGDEPRRAAMGRAARARAVERFGARTMAQSLAGELRSLALESEGR
jgi:glycosyltransferase involved in cell wall biosynthesis